VRRGSRRFAVEDLVSAGGIVYRRGPGGTEVILCGRPSRGLWALPKGTPERAETLEETARREVSEETGLLVDIERKIGEIEYWFTRAEVGKRFRKRVHHYLMRPIGGDTANHDHEYDEVRWFPIGEAKRRLTFTDEVEMLDKALVLIEHRAEGERDDGR
jgi:8-oxo-dGTP pyrophosphatase MutT (NUDIX family)